MAVRLRKTVAVYAVGLMLLALMGCGYTFAPQGEHIDPAIRTIYIEPFGNQTAQAEIENLMRSAFIDQLLQTSRFRVVADAGLADAVVSGNVLVISTVAISYRKSIMAAEERMSVILEASLRERETGKILWASRNVGASVDYELQDDINLLPATRRKAMTKLSRDTAERALNLMLSNF